MPALTGALEKNPGEDVCAAIIRAIKEIDPDVGAVLPGLAKVARKHPAGHLRGRAVNVLGDLDPDGSHVGAVLLDALQKDAERTVVPLGDTHVLTSVMEAGTLDIGLPRTSGYGRAGATVRYPVVFRNGGQESISVKLDCARQNGGLMDAVAAPDGFELKAGEAVTSWIGVKIGEDAGRGAHEVQTLQIAVDGHEAEEVAFETARSTRLTSLNVGDEASEVRHEVKTENAPVVGPDPETLGQAGRRFKPGRDEDKGWVAFDADVSPSKQNYVTVRVWGSEKTVGPVRLFAAHSNEQIGDIWGGFGVRPQPFPGRWIYRTYPIPAEVTEGQEELRLRLQSSGKSWAVYNVYVHEGPFFEVPEGERQGEPLVLGPTRGESVDLSR
ncbi:MAG: HEAT repeat domain-containing protein, partial [Planctomycetota bacterium]